MCSQSDIFPRSHAPNETVVELKNGRHYRVGGNDGGEYFDFCNTLLRGNAYLQFSELVLLHYE